MHPNSVPQYVMLWITPIEKRSACCFLVDFVPKQDLYLSTLKLEWYVVDDKHTKEDYNSSMKVSEIRDFMVVKSDDEEKKLSAEKKKKKKKKGCSANVVLACPLVKKSSSCQGINSNVCPYMTALVYQSSLPYERSLPDKNLRV